MSSTNTDHTWYWYIRNKGKRGYIGIVNESGDACDTADYEIKIYYDQIPDEVDENSEIPIPTQFENVIAMGCVYDILRMYGIERSSYLRDYLNGISKAKHYVNSQSNSPITIQNYDVREDDNA